MGCGASKKKNNEEVVRETAPTDPKAEKKPAEKNEAAAATGTAAAASPVSEGGDKKQETAGDATPVKNDSETSPHLASAASSDDGKEEKRVLPTREELLKCMEECRARLEQVSKERQEQKLPLHTSEDPMLMLIFMGEAMQIGQKYNITTIQDMDSVKQQYKDDDEVNTSHEKLKTLLTKHGLPV